MLCKKSICRIQAISKILNEVKGKPNSLTINSGGGKAQLVELRASNRKVAKSWIVACHCVQDT